MRTPLPVSAAVLSLSTFALYSVAVPSAAHADPLPAPYAAHAASDVLTLDADLATVDLADVGIGHSSATVDSQLATDPVTASSANLAAAIGGLGLPLTAVTATAPPSETVQGQVPPVVVPALLALGLVQSTASAAYGDASTCLPAVAGVRQLGRGTTRLAGAQVVPLLGTTVASVGAVTTTSSTSLVDGPGGRSSVVSETTSQIGDISLLGGQVLVHVADPVTLTATSDGTTGAVTYAAPTVTLTLADSTVIDLGNQPNDTYSGTVPLVLADAAVSVSLVDDVDTSAGATATGDLAAVLRISVAVTTPLGPLASVDLGVSPMSVDATAPTGGVECGDPGAVDTDGDGLTDAQETSGSANPYGGAPTLPDDADSDDDGLSDGEEVSGSQNPTGAPTDPNDADTDDDTVSDGDELSGVTNVDFGSAPTNPLDADTDGDFLDDGVEISGSANTAHGNEPTDPNSADTDGDGTDDGVETTDGSDPNDPTDPGTVPTDTDGDGLTDVQETSGSANDDWGNEATDPLDADSDDDGLPDGGEITLGTNPNAADSDADGDTDGEEHAGSVNTAFGQQPTNPLDPDSDDDGLTDGQETSGSANSAHGNLPTNPNVADTDGDGVGDGTETTAGTDPNVANGATPPTNPGGGDPDGDGLSTTTELALGTNPLVADTDGDGLLDGVEVSGSANTRYASRPTDPKDADSDDDGLRDGVEVLGVKVRDKVVKTGKKKKPIGVVRTDPNVKDTDRDGLTDGREVAGMKIKQKVVTTTGRAKAIGLVHTNPLKKDTDGDGIKDGAEVKGSKNKRFARHRSDPTHWDTDRGGNSDGLEVALGSDPSNVWSSPRTPRGMR